MHAVGFNLKLVVEKLLKSKLKNFIRTSLDLNTKKTVMHCNASLNQTKGNRLWHITCF